MISTPPAQFLPPNPATRRQGADGRLCAPGAEPAVSPELVAAVAAGVLEFVTAVSAGRLVACGLQRAKGPEDGPPAGAALQALQAAQVGRTWGRGGGSGGPAPGREARAPSPQSAAADGCARHSCAVS